MTMQEVERAVKVLEGSDGVSEPVSIYYFRCFCFHEFENSLDLLIFVTVYPFFSVYTIILATCEGKDIKIVILLQFLVVQCVTKEKKI